MAVVGRYPESTEAPDEENDHSNGAKEYFCGFGKWRPKSLQVFRNSKFFTFLMCINSTIEGALVSGMHTIYINNYCFKKKKKKAAIRLVIDIIQL